VALVSSQHALGVAYFQTTTASGHSFYLIDSDQVSWIAADLAFLRGVSALVAGVDVIEQYFAEVVHPPSHSPAFEFPKLLQAQVALLENQVLLIAEAEVVEDVVFLHSRIAFQQVVELVRLFSGLHKGEEFFVLGDQGVPDVDAEESELLEESLRVLADWVGSSVILHLELVGD